MEARKGVRSKQVKIWATYTTVCMVYDCVSVCVGVTIRSREPISCLKCTDPKKVSEDFWLSKGGPMGVKVGVQSNTPYCIASWETRRFLSRCRVD